MKKIIIAALALGILIPSATFAAPRGGTIHQKIRAVIGTVVDLKAIVADQENKITTLNEEIEHLETVVAGFEQVLTVEDGELGGDSLLRTTVGGSHGTSTGIGAQGYGYGALQYATAADVGCYGVFTCRYASRYGDFVVGNFVLQQEGYVGDQNSHIGGGGYYNLLEGLNNSSVGNGILLQARIANRNSLSGLGVASSAYEVNRSTISGEDGFSEDTELIDTVTGLGWEVGKNSTGDHGVYLGPRSGLNETEDNKFHLSNMNGRLAEGSFTEGWVTIFGELTITESISTPEVTIGEVTLIEVDGDLFIELSDGTRKQIVTTE